MIKEYLKKNLILTDGAMGTYYSLITGNNPIYAELSNIDNPQIIKQIHKEYIEAGAKLIRTNTFSSNSFSLQKPNKQVSEIISTGYKIAKEACKGKDVFIAANIGPIPEVLSTTHETNEDTIINQYKFIIDTFLNLGANIFNFETFSNSQYLKDITKYIKDKNSKSFIITQFTFMPDGYTRNGIGLKRLLKEVKKIKTIDAYGLNCGVGPTHMYTFIQEIDFTNDIISVLPNAGFPEVVNERMVYSQNASYFANIMSDIINKGAKIIGGCCGTTPLHIKKINELINKNKKHKPNIQILNKKISPQTPTLAPIQNTKSKNFMLTVELDPPFGNDVSKLLKAAKTLKNAGVDIITVADSPLGRSRMSSLMVAAKIKREIKIDVMPHICCRDRNIIAIKSDILGSYMEGVRNILAVTGDPVASGFKDEIKSVFNLNSINLINLISEMNNETFIKEPINIGGALNLNTKNKDKELERAYKKFKAGASYFLTQPIFNSDIISYLKKIDTTRPFKIYAGIMPIVSYRNAQFLNNEIPGIHIPDKYINMFNENMSRQQAQEIGIEIAIQLTKEIRNYVDGFYFITPFNRADIIAEIIKRTGETGI